MIPLSRNEIGVCGGPVLADGQQEAADRSRKGA